MKYTLSVLIFTVVTAQGTTLKIDMLNTFFGETNPFVDENSVNLLSGDLVQLGYFETAGAPTTNGDSFNSFVPIETVAFTVGVSGEFSDTADLIDTVDLPSTNSQQLQFGLRIFNAPAEGTATRFNTVTDSDWTFTFWNGVGAPPTNSSMALDPNFGIEAPVWQDSGNPFQTSITIVPEPSTSLTALLGLAFLTGKRRRK